MSFILFFGFFAEFLFKKFYIPDVLFLIILGFILGPHALNYVNPLQLSGFAPVFTSFALLFLLFDGAFNIDLSSFAKGLSKSIAITFFNFLVSSLLIAGILFVFKLDPMVALMTGFMLGGVSSAFVIPVIKQMNLKDETYSVLTLESALSDVFCIVFALTVIEVILINSIQVRVVMSTIASLFAVAGLIGIVCGILWIMVTRKIFKEHRSYMVTIAYVILVYVITEWLGGNGAIATLFLGLVLRNSQQLTSIFRGIITTDEYEKQEAMSGLLGVAVIKSSEKFFYGQISFFLKTFFFVYIGLLIDLSDLRATIIGIIISFVVLGARNASSLLTRRWEQFDRTIINSIFARGLAAAAVAQIAVAALPDMDISIVPKIVYVVITGTIILSSARVFWLKIKQKKGEELQLTPPSAPPSAQPVTTGSNTP